MNLMNNGIGVLIMITIKIRDTSHPMTSLSLLDMSLPYRLPSRSSSILLWRGWFSIDPSLSSKFIPCLKSAILLNGATSHDGRESPAGDDAGDLSWHFGDPLSQMVGIYLTWPWSADLQSPLNIPMPSSSRNLFACGSLYADAKLSALQISNTRYSTLYRRITDQWTAGVGDLLCLNPAWWGDPIQRASEVLTLRKKLLDLQVDLFPSFDSTSDQLKALAQFTLVPQPQYFEVSEWAQYPEIQSQIKIYEQSVWSGLAIGGSTVGGLIIAILIGFGLLHFAGNHDIHPEYRWLRLVWGIGIVVVILILTPAGVATILFADLSIYRIHGYLRCIHLYQAFSGANRSLNYGITLLDRRSPMWHLADALDDLWSRLTLGIRRYYQPGSGNLAP